jgi:hypothetical protein
MAVVFFALIAGACSRTDSVKSAQNGSPSPISGPTTDDVWIASHAMTVGEVELMLRAGNAQEKIIAEVRKRHFVGSIVEATELELNLNGARHELIAELKNKANWLTEAQEQAYGQLMAHRQAAAQRPSATPRPR